MEQRNNLVLHGTETFSRGALDNVALESGAVVLDSSAGRYLPYGSYTTPEFAMPAFCNLNVSWNASAPHNTMVEVRCRVYAGNTWTGWLSFGKWAPDYPRCSIKAQSEDGLVFLMGDTVTVATPGGGTVPAPGGDSNISGGDDEGLFGWIWDLLKDIVKSILKAIFKIIANILGFLIWIVERVGLLLPFLPGPAVAALGAGVVLVFVIRIIRFIRG